MTANAENQDNLQAVLVPLRRSWGILVRRRIEVRLQEPASLTFDRELRRV